MNMKHLQVEIDRQDKIFMTRYEAPHTVEEARRDLQHVARHIRALFAAGEEIKAALRYYLEGCSIGQQSQCGGRCNGCKKAVL